jgi:hypothetical protein
VRIANEQKAILDVLKGEKNLSADVQNLKMHDNAGQLDPQCQLVDTLKIFLATRQSKKERSLGKDILEEFTKPPYGWDAGAIRVGVAALVRAGIVKIVISKKVYTNPLDSELQDAMRVGKSFNGVELVLEDIELDPDLLTEVRKLLIRLTGNKKIDETPSAISTAMESFGKDLTSRASQASVWAEAAGLPLATEFSEADEAFQKVLALTNPSHRVKEIYDLRDALEDHASIIKKVVGFVEKWKKAYLEMRDFANDLRLVRHKLPPDGACAGFLDNWDKARQDKNVIEDGVWKALQDSKASASLELQQILASFKERAINIISEGLARLPSELVKWGLPSKELEAPLAEPLKVFLKKIDEVTDLTSIIGLPEKAQALIKQMDQKILEEFEKRKPPERPAPPKKPAVSVRIAQVVPSTRIQTIDQWHIARTKIDEFVERVLQEGNEVELE